MRRPMASRGAGHARSPRRIAGWSCRGVEAATNWSTSGRSTTAREAACTAPGGTGPGPPPLPIPTAGHVVLGFEFDRAGAADRLAERLPPQLARHAAVAL